MESCKRIEQVQQFHNVGGHPVGTTPNTLTVERYLQRMKWIVEELEEGLTAVSGKDKKEFIDALADAEYFLMGTVVEAGMQAQFAEAFNRVHAANMKKFPTTVKGAVQTMEKYAAQGINTYYERVTYNGEDFFVVYFSDGDKAGKIAKAWNWTEPDHTDLFDEDTK